MSDAESNIRPYIGGQAVLEGVMMRSPTSLAVVVRRADGSLYIRERAISDPRKGYEKWPFFRGIASMIEALKIGNEALRFSAEQLEKDASQRAFEHPKPGASISSAFMAFHLSLISLVTGSDEAKGPTVKGERKGLSFTLMMMVLFMVALPQVTASGVDKIFGLNLDIRSGSFQALTGAIKLFIIVGYMFLIRRVPEIRRVFQYHGAEHKTISTYEAREELTVLNALKKTTLHPRCGTTFLVMVVMVSVLTFTALGALLPKIELGNRLLNNLVFFLIKLPFVPVIASVTFEVQRIFAKFFTQGPLRVVLWPGFLVQKITTIEPDENQLEVALASLRVTLFREAGFGKEGVTEVGYENYDSLLQASLL